MDVTPGEVHALIQIVLGFWKEIAIALDPVLREASEFLMTATLSAGSKLYLMTGLSSSESMYIFTTLIPRRLPFLSSVRSSVRKKKTWSILEDLSME